MKPVRIGLVGDYQSGKSTLINCLLKRSIARVGNGISTTHAIVNYRYEENEHIEYLNRGVRESVESTILNGLETYNSIEVINVYLNDVFLKGIVLTDMPGFGFDENDNKTSEAIMKTLDYAIVVMTNYKAIEEESSYFKVIQRLKITNIPYYFILNCADHKSSTGKWHPLHPDNTNIARRDFECVVDYKPLKYPFEDETIPIVNLMWYWFAIKGKDDEMIGRYSDIFETYGLFDSKVNKTDIIKASNFESINKIFDMDNRAFLELRKDFKEEIQKLREELCPIGTIQAFAFDSIPSGWLFCDGRKKNIEDYPELFKKIGTTFGGDGKLFFNLPDLQERFVRGWKDKERRFGSYQEDAFQQHNHIVPEHKTRSCGEHTHKVYYDLKWAKQISTFSNDVCMRIIPDYHNSSNSFGGDPGTNESGSHCHTINSTQTNNVCVDSFVHVDNETRPKNIALLYCIKAENLCSADTSTESGYSTIVEKVKKEIVPLCETLPVVEIGGDEYLVNIESIKESHFCNHPNCRQELVYITAKCFKDICLYNSRLGLREDGFDEYGLDLLVSWMVDKEMVEKEEKLLFIDKVKHYITSFLSNVSPMQ